MIHFTSTRMEISVHQRFQAPGEPREGANLMNKQYPVTLAREIWRHYFHLLSLLHYCNKHHYDIYIGCYQFLERALLVRKRSLGLRQVWFFSTQLKPLPVCHCLQAGTTCTLWKQVLSLFDTCVDVLGTTDSWAPFVVMHTHSLIPSPHPMNCIKVKLQILNMCWVSNLFMECRLMTPLSDHGI